MRTIHGHGPKRIRLGRTDVRLAQVDVIGRGRGRAGRSRCCCWCGLYSASNTVNLHFVSFHSPACRPFFGEYAHTLSRRAKAGSGPVKHVTCTAAQASRPSLSSLLIVAHNLPVRVSGMLTTGCEGSSSGEKRIDARLGFQMKQAPASPGQMTLAKGDAR